jgi:hypothetical protein
MIGGVLAHEAGSPNSFPTFCGAFATVSEAAIEARRGEAKPRYRRAEPRGSPIRGVAPLAVIVRLPPRQFSTVEAIRLGTRTTV